MSGSRHVKGHTIVTLLVVCTLSGCMQETPEERALDYLAADVDTNSLSGNIQAALAAASLGVDITSWPDPGASVHQDLTEPESLGDTIRLLHALELQGADAPQVTRAALQERVVMAAGDPQFPYGGSVFTNAIVVSALLAGDTYHPYDEEVYTSTSFLVDRQAADGGWDATGGQYAGETDTTAVVVRALADAGLLTGEVRSGAKEFLEAHLADDGSYDFEGTTNCQSSALALMAWAGLGTDPPEEAVDYVLSCQNPDGGFPHVKGGPSQNWATAEILQGLAARS